LPSSLTSIVLTARPGGERQTFGTERIAELIDRLWPHAMDLLELALAQPSALLEPPGADLRERAARRFRVDRAACCQVLTTAYVNMH